MGLAGRGNAGAELRLRDLIGIAGPGAVSGCGPGFTRLGHLQSGVFAAANFFEIGGDVADAHQAIAVQEHSAFTDDEDVVGGAEEGEAIFRFRICGVAEECCRYDQGRGRRQGLRSHKRPDVSFGFLRFDLLRGWPRRPVDEDIMLGALVLGFANVIELVNAQGRIVRLSTARISRRAATAARTRNEPLRLKKYTRASSTSSPARM